MQDAWSESPPRHRPAADRRSRRRLRRLIREHREGCPERLTPREPAPSADHISDGRGERWRVAPSPAASPAPAASPSVTSTASATPSSATKDEGRPACPDPPTHVVAAGETLSGIAQGYGVTVQALRAANPQIRDPRLIHPGDAIVISPIDLGASWVRDPLLINDRGQIAGSADGGSGDSRAFLWQGGTLTDLGTLGGRESVATDINDRGQVVGQADTASGEEHAFLWQDGTMTDLGTLRRRAAGAVAINERGQIVGWSGDAAGDRRAFLWQDGTMTDLGTLGGNYTSASAINDRGQVVGASTTTSGEGHAFLWQDGTMTDLGTLGGGGSGADAINDEGQIVGMVSDPPGGPDIMWEHGRGFVWQDGVMRDLGIDFDGQPRGPAWQP